jgi:hypothetical protein
MKKQKKKQKTKEKKKTPVPIGPARSKNSTARGARQLVPDAKRVK